MNFQRALVPPIVPRVPVRPSPKSQLIEMPQPARYSVPTGKRLVHQPPLACIRERAAVGKPASSRHRQAEVVHRSAKREGGLQARPPGSMSYVWQATLRTGSQAKVSTTSASSVTVGCSELYFATERSTESSASHTPPGPAAPVGVVEGAVGAGGIRGDSASLSALASRRRCVTPEELAQRESRPENSSRWPGRPRQGSEDRRPNTAGIQH